MATSDVKQLPKQTAQIILTIPWSEISLSYEKILETVTKTAEIDGFRKGKAPKKIVEEKVDKAKLYEEVVKDVVPKAYTDALKEHKLIPVISPKIELTSAKQGEDWIITTTIALRPKVDLKDYKDKVRQAKKADTKIWVPGSGDEKKSEEKKPSLDDILKALSEYVEVEMSDLLVDNEVNRLLADTFDQTKKLGLSVEQYLSAKNKTIGQLKAEYQQQAHKSLSIEFALATIADTENITVSPKDIEEVISKVEDPKEKERLTKDSYYLAHLIRQQKTLDFLANL